MVREAWQAMSVGSQRVGHDRSDLAQHSTLKQQCFFSHLPWPLVTIIIISVSMNLATLGTSYVKSQSTCPLVLAYFTHRNVLKVLSCYSM